jgi:hypothetical protein
MNPGRIVAGYIGLIVPLGLTFFGLVMAAITGWRRWFGLPLKKKRRKK